MTPIHYSKLVRDNIPDEIQKKGGKVTYHIAGSDEEYWHKLKQKIQEEIDEFSKHETIENLADVMEVLEAVIQYKQYDKRDIAAIQENKGIEKGKFEKRVILDSSTQEVGLEQDRVT